MAFTWLWRVRLNSQTYRRALYVSLAGISFVWLQKTGLLSVKAEEQNVNDGGKLAGSVPFVADKFKVAVLGAGVGGSTATYFIRKALGSSVEIDVFEKTNKIGGRTGVIEMGGNYFEAGGSIIHESNQYLSDFCTQYGLIKNQEMGTGSRMGIYNGDEFVFLSTGWKIIDTIKLFWRYGSSLITMDRFLGNMLKDFGNIYALQNSGRSFETVPEMLEAIGGNTFVNYTQVTASEALKDVGISQKVIDELATAVTRCNYGQDMSVNAFTGFVSLAGAQSGKLFSVKGGNYQIPENIIKNSSVNLHLETKVSSILKVNTTDGNIKYQLKTDQTIRPELYDVVIVALPLEVPSDYVSCDSCTHWPDKKHMDHFQLTVATFIQGNIRSKRFGLNDDNEVPDALFTTENPKIYFNSIGYQKNVEKSEIGKISPPIYKVFSREPLTDKQIDDLFTDKKDIKVKKWLAYPHYETPEKLAPFVLDNGVFYINSIERAASAMEMSAIGGKNAALLTEKYLNATANGNNTAQKEETRTRQEL